MTDKELAVIVQAIAPIVKDYAVKAVGEAQARIAVLEAQLMQVGDVRDRVIVMETKSAHFPSLPQVDLSPMLERLAIAESAITRLEAAELLEDKHAADLRKDLSRLLERVAVVEVRPAIPGPPGEPGPPGKDGTNGKDGTAGISFEGVYQEGQSYEKGNLVTWGGSSWHCNEPTTTKPGDGSKAWTLMVKRGRDGRDGLNGKDVAPVVKVT